MKARLALAALPALPALLVGLGCDGSGDSVAFRTTVARARWEDRGPADYRMTVTNQCAFCGKIDAGPVEVVVRDGRIVSRTYLDDGSEVPESFRKAFPDVDGLFDELENAIRTADHVEAEFDPGLGYPVHTYVDYATTAADDEVGHTLSDFQVLTPSGSRSP